jgi:hypothetical protein
MVLISVNDRALEFVNINNSKFVDIDRTKVVVGKRNIVGFRRKVINVNGRKAITIDKESIEATETKRRSQNMNMFFSLMVECNYYKKLNC